MDSTRVSSMGGTTGTAGKIEESEGSHDHFAPIPSFCQSYGAQH